MKLQNISGEARIWPSLQFTDGRTLELAAGEVGDVAVQDCPLDAFLAPYPPITARKGSGKGKAAQGGSGAEDAPRGLSDVDPTAGSGDPSADHNEPAEADASGKEA